MSALILRNRFQGNATLVENKFIDNYMAAANGEYVKVYLLLLRHMNNPCASLSISQMADCLENTEGDILRALKYWEKEGLLALEYDSSRNVIGLEMGKVPQPDNRSVQITPSNHTSSPAEIPVTVSPAASVSSTSAPEPVKTKSKSDSAGNAVSADNAAPSEQPHKRSAQNRKELKQILFIAEQYLSKTLTRTDVDTITYFYDSLGFSADLIEYLIEYCVENGHKSMHYIQKVALSWADEHITSVEQARNTSALYNKACYSILKSFGIKGRGPAAPELEFIRKWTDTDAFDLEIILEACNRTMLAIHQPSFEYTDKILSNWKDKNVHTLADIRVLDSAFEQEKSSQKKSPRRTSAPSASSKFRSFEERSYDMDELTRELLRSN